MAGDGTRHDARGGAARGCPKTEMDSAVRPEDCGEDAPAPWTGVLRASGKRFRRRFNPNDWESSILTVRHNVLCLGMSYPCVDTLIANYTGKNNRIFHSEPSVERSVELVRRNLLNQIDGRDLARVVALEANNDILAYTVSMEQGAHYDQRHLHADFNSRTLVNQMRWRWGDTVRFRQVILDYFWSPSGSWAMKHWQRSFFNENIPRFVTERMFNFGDLENDSLFVSALEANTTEDFISSTAAVVYLPFSSHCLSQVVACYNNLSQFYTISFLRKDQLDEHTLWKATNTISPESMSGWLAKTINQEEIYCTLDARQIKHGAGDASVTQEEILDVFYRIDRSNEVRMIKLTALRKFHPNYSKSEFQRARPTLGLNKGGYVGLLGKHDIGRKNEEANISSGALSEKIKQSKLPRKMSLSHLQFCKLGVPVTKKMPRKRSLSHQHLDRLVEPKKFPREKSLSHHQLDKLVGRKRRFSHHQLDKLGNRKKSKRDDTSMHQDPEKFIRFSASANAGLPTESPNESTAQMVLAFEWQRILTSFELDYANRINSSVTFDPNDTQMNSMGKDHKTILEIEYANPVVPHFSLGLNEARNDKEKDSKAAATNIVFAPGRAQTIQEVQFSKSSNDLPTSNFTCSAKKDPSHTPAAMTKIAKLRRVKPLKSVETSVAKEDREAREFSQPGQETAPDTNDVLMRANHYSHPGNMQFFNALSMCTHDFSTVSDCFIGALKALKGRCLAKDEEKDTWACIDYDTAISLVPHLLDSYELNSANGPYNSCPNLERSCLFLSEVQRLFNVKFKGREKLRNFCQVEDELSDKHSATQPQCQATLANFDVNINSENFEKFVSSSKNPGLLGGATGAVPSIGEEKSANMISNLPANAGRKELGGVAKPDATKRRGGKGKSLTLLALAEQEGNSNTSSGNEGDDFNPVSSKGVIEVKTKTGRKGKSCALALALDREQELEIMDASNDTDKNTIDKVDRPSLAEVTESSAANSSGISDSSSTGASSVTDRHRAEESSFRCLAQWIQPSSAYDISTTGGINEFEIALKQISEQGNISVCKIMAQAFEEEAASLRSFCTER